MKNKEKNLETLAQFALENKIIALKNGKLVDCNTCNCSDCSFYPEPGVNESCRDVQKRWAEAECEEDSLLNKQEKDFLQFQCDHLTPAPTFIERAYLNVSGELLEIKSADHNTIAVFYGTEGMYQNLMLWHEYTLGSLGLKSRSAKR